MYSFFDYANSDFLWESESFRHNIIGNKFLAWRLYNASHIIISGIMGNGGDIDRVEGQTFESSDTTGS